MISSVLTYRTPEAINSAMGRVFGHMSLAVVTSMLVSAWVGTNPAAMAFFFTGIMKWIVIFAPLVAVFAVGMALEANPPKGVAVAMLHGFAALMGLSFASIFVVYNLGSIFSAFMGAAVLFAIMSIYGYFTKRSLDSLGKWLFVGLIAIVIVSIINIFVGNTVLQMVISGVAVLLFLALTAYDTQRIREMLYDGAAGDAAEVSGALSLYLNFINIFLNLLQLFGDKNDD